MTVSTENYLKTIYQIINENEKKATCSLIAKKLNISNAAITDMAKKLSEQGYVIYTKYKDIKLTKSGAEIALAVLRRHRLWELFLHNVLNIAWDKIHDEAEKLEHQSSDFLMNEIDKFLNYPDFDPHGDPIPDINGNLPKNPNQINLTKAKIGKYTISRVIHNHDMFDFLNQNGFKLGNALSISQKVDNNNLLIEINNKQIILNTDLANKIYVIKIKENGN